MKIQSALKGGMEAFTSIGKDVMGDLTLLGKVTIGPPLVILAYFSFILMAPPLLFGLYVHKAVEYAVKQWPVLGTNIDIVHLFIRKDSSHF